MKKYLIGGLIGLIIAAIAAVVLYTTVLKPTNDSSASVNVVPAPEEMSIAKADTITNDFAEKTIIIDKEYMAMHYKKYEYYETTVKLSDFLDNMTEFSLDNVVSVFQATDSVGTTTVYKTGHDLLTKTDWLEVIPHAFWVEDINMCDDSLSVIGFEAAFKRVTESDYKKPHSAYVVLRKQIGPHPSNPQYIFGNIHAGMLYVDAVTGDVSDKNPVFPSKK